MGTDKLYNVENPRAPFIDSLKGIAILLVVISHAIVSMLGVDQANKNIIFRICYSFHMPLFMSISGFFTGVLLKTGNGLKRGHPDYCYPGQYGLKYLAL